MRKIILIVLGVICLFVFGGVKNTLAQSKVDLKPDSKNSAPPNCGWCNRRCINKNDNTCQSQISNPKNLDCVRKGAGCEIVASYDNSTSPRPTTEITPTAAPKRYVRGDVNDDGKVDLVDFDMWKTAYLANTTSLATDFNHDEKTNLVDFRIWKDIYLSN